MADSGVVSRLTSANPDSRAYLERIGDRRVAINFQVEAELRGCNFGSERMQRLNDLTASLIKLPQTEATITWYARVAKQRREFQRLNIPAGNPGDGDMWVISSALEHRLELLCHDGPAIELGRALGLRVFTCLPALTSGNPE